MGRKTILTCAVTGNITMRSQHPKLPISPPEIAAAAVDAARHGAAVAHIHARDPETGRGSMEVTFFREIIERIRDSGSDVIVNFSTGEGGRFVPDKHEPSLAALGTTLTSPERRVAHVEALRPEICSLDLNTMFSGSSVVINTPGSVEIMAQRMYKAGVLPELELFDSGDIHLAHDLLSRGVLRKPALCQIVLGVRFGAPANPATLFYLSSQLPPDSIWAAFGIGRTEFPMLAQSWLLGGHVRVGLEDNIYVKKGVLARDNTELVDKAVTIVENLGGTIASSADARAILGLSGKKQLIMDESH
jgi:uncharacterized protein (DUF849 family)